jgi:glycosyltransferase involved in cell wall biosynthesis
MESVPIMNEKNIRLAVCMPVYNESEGIREFVTEIATAFEGHETYFYVVDDCSSDGSNVELNYLSHKLKIEVYRNQHNLGHGPSTLKALNMAILNDHSYIIAVDGDGQFLASEIYRLTINTIQSGSEIGLGLRIRKNEPPIRKVISFATRILVYLKTNKMPKDANTPLRIYKQNTLSKLIKELETTNPIPNLFLLKAIYMGNFRVWQEKVVFTPRRGISKTGTSWGKTLRIFPQKRLLLFSWNAINYWFKH